MGGYIARLYLPVESTVRQEMEQLTAGNVVLGVHQVEVAVQGIDDDAVGHAYFFDLRGAGEAVADYLVSAYVNDAVGDGVGHRLLTPLRTVEVEGVAHDAEVADGLFQSPSHTHGALGVGCQPADARGGVVVVASRGDPQLPVFVGLQMVEVWGYLNAPCLVHGGEVDDAYGTLVTLSRHTLITTAVGHVEALPNDRHLFRLVTHSTGVNDLQRQGIYLEDTAQRTATAVIIDGADIRRYVGIAAIEGDVATVGDVDLSYPDGISGTGYLYLVGAVDDEPQARAIDLDIVTHVAEHHYGRGVALRIDVAVVMHGGVLCREVEIVEGGLVGTHVTLVEQIHADDLALHRLAACVDVLHGYHHHVITTSADQCTIHNAQCIIGNLLHISTLKVSV